MSVNCIESNPIPVKAALAMTGMPEENFRLLLVPIGDSHRSRLEEVLREPRLLKEQ